MSFDRQHEIHTRRFGRNLGVGAVLLMLVGIVFGLTVVKVTHLVAWNLKLDVGHFHNS